MAANALIFDLDGTVWDSAAWFAERIAGPQDGVRQALQSELRGCGNIVGILRRYGINRTTLIAKARREGSAPRLFNGMREAIASISAKNLPLGVATSLPGSLALPMLDLCGLGETFDAIVHAGTCRAAKPSPASIQLALKMLDVTPSSDTFYIGDRVSDAEASRRAGVSFAWMEHGYERPHPDEGVRLLTPAALGTL